MSEWRETTFGALGQIFDGPHATPERIIEGPYFLNISSLKNGRLDLAESDHVSEEEFVRWTKRVTPQEGDLLFSYETRLGDAALMPAGVRACLGRRMALFRPDRAAVDPRFLLYMYLAPEFQATIERNTVQGATVDRIPLKLMAGWSVRIPERGTQRAIAGVLGALDDKIGANSEIATVSDGLALALASRFAPSVALGGVARQSKETINPAALDDESVIHYSLPAYDAGQNPDVVSPTTIKSNKFLVAAPGVLLSKLNPRFPRVWNLAELSSGVSLASTEFVVLRSDYCSPSLLWSLVAQPRFGAELEGMVAGTSGSHQRVKPSEILAVEVPDPREIPAEDVQLIESLALRAIAAREETRRLASIRDALLPALMSGRLTVRNGEIVEEGAVSGGVFDSEALVPGTLW